MIHVVARAHLFGAFALTASCAIGGACSAYCWARKLHVPRLLRVWYAICYVLVYAQVTLGVVLYGRGLRPAEATHVLYGITPAVAIVVLQASKQAIQPRLAAVMTVALFAFAGMGVRGILTGFG